MPTENGRRRFIAGLGTATLAGVAGCMGVLQSDGDGNEDPQPGTDEGTTPDESNEDDAGDETEADLTGQLNEVEGVTEKYADPRAALEDGFKLNGPYVPGMGWHFTHPERLQQAAENGPSLTEPPMLTYLDNEDTDGLELASVEYAVPSDAVDGELDLFNDEDADATETWHTHEGATHLFANGNGEQDDPRDLSFEELTTKENWAEFHPVDESLEEGDTIALNWGRANAKEGDHKEERVIDLVANHPSVETLHAWVHVDNPDGVFAPVHSEYAGGGHDHEDDGGDDHDH